MQRSHPIVSIQKTTRDSSTRVPFEYIAKTILGGGYELSLVLCGDALARRINCEYRQKTYSPNVLSFPLDEHFGEIFLNVRKAERESKQMNIPIRSRMAHLFVHGCFHLKGLRHGNEMERREDLVLKQFGFLSTDDLGVQK
jgi:rRNA maturation RNase YbeY